MALRKAQSAALLSEDCKYVRPSYRQKGSEVKGSLFKGATANAFTKKTIGSIPSKFETVLYPQNASMRKGFGSNSFRFNATSSENPGPGAYIDPGRTSATNFNMVSDSYSRKGLGNGFVSTSNRFKIENYYVYQVPGPGSYKHTELNDNVKEQFVGQSFGLGSVSEKYKRKTMAVFNTEGSTRRSQKSALPPKPGPGAYNIPRVLTNPQEYKHTAAFKAKENRFFKVKTENPLGPGHYETDMEGIKRQLLHGGLGVVGEQTTSANFKQPTGSKRVKVNLYDPFENVEGDEKKTPGPGHYPEDQFSIVRKTTEKSAVGVSSMFANHDILDRFGKPKQEVKNALEKLTPGPGQYSPGAPPIDEDDEYKKAKPGIACPFKSEVKRIAYIPTKHGPGPAFYKLKGDLTKETKNINPTREWL